MDNMHPEVSLDNVNILTKNDSPQNAEATAVLQKMSS